ncbi:CBS and ACT domain-containing protein [Melghirimyces algeriensis]|uniref:Acetoin utilization protein AcuB n=1 Tax=Melghirimyces algeriensis TaxID=910412 RepID=A0A521CLG3_9BACL|nr:CBS and ACT domain-containing protein [Melghirimyces algeriensis]SMO60293.1 acetoin utilization protein AcuB [Melghirimyces algeriensis]
MLVEEIMHSKIYSVTPCTSIQEALKQMKKHHVRHLPVIDGDQLVGLVTDRDLRSASPSTLAPKELQELLKRPVSEIMVAPAITVHPLDFLEDAARLLYENRIGCLPVLKGDRLVGILTETDILHRLMEIFGVNHPSQHVEVEVEDQIGILAQVANIFSDHRVNINSVLVEGNPAKGKINLVFRVQAKDLSKIVRDINRAGHRVLWPQHLSGPNQGEMT